MDTCTLVECKHMPVPMPEGCCSYCKNDTPVKNDRFYNRHKDEVLLSPGRNRINNDLVMWYPYLQDAPRLESIVHICGGWAGAHIKDLLKGNRNLYVVEFAPAQKAQVSTYLSIFADQSGGAVGVSLLSRR